MKRSPVGCFLLFLAVIVLGIPALVFAGRAGQAQVAAQQAADVEYYTVARGDVEVAVSAIGSVEANETANLSFTSAGRIAEIFVQPGEAITAGTVLARLANDAQQIALDQAALGLEMARARKEDVLAGPDAGEIAVAEANIDAAWGAYYASLEGASSDDIRAAELAVQQSEAALTAAQEARSTASGGQGEQAYQILDAQIGEAAFNVEISRLQLQQLQNGGGAQSGAAFARVEQAEAQLAQLLAGATQSQIDSADATIAQAQAAVDRAQAALNDTLLIAPFDGVVSSVSVEIGDLVSPSLPVMGLIDLTPLRVRVDVDEIDVRSIREGMDSLVTFDAIDALSVPATLEQIALLGENENGIISYPVTLRLADAVDPRVRAGMTAEAEMVVQAQRDVIVVPNAYVRLDRQAERAFVERVNAEGVLEEIEITLGLQGDETSEVTSGLREGDVIAVDLGGDVIPAFGG